VEILIIYALDTTPLLPHTLHRPPALLPLAGSAVLGHVLHQLRDLPAGCIRIVTPAAQQTAVADWLAGMAPQLNAQVTPCSDGANFVEALAHCADFLGADELLVAPGEVVVEVDFTATPATDDAVASWVCASSDAAHAARVTLDGAQKTITAMADAAPWTHTGLFWLRRGADLCPALEAALAENGATPGDLLAHLLRRPQPVAARQAFMHAAVNTRPNWLAANARLLGLGYGSEDAIERSYAEDFTVIPPVFIHATAVVEHAVVGPFVNIEAGATVRGSILRNTLVGQQTAVADAVLDGAIIGRHSQVNGRAYAVQAGDEALIELA
jgi:glucose-1-phosphate thymidylyltransferase